MATKTRQKQTKLEELQQTDGRAVNPRIQSLDQILGEARKRYTYGSKDDYKTFLKGMNLTDMHEEARKRGLTPIMDRPLLEKRLVREFEKTASQYYGTATPDPMPGELSDAAKAVLASGR